MAEEKVTGYKQANDIFFRKYVNALQDYVDLKNTVFVYFKRLSKW
jgi:hypothetical protein